MRNRHGFTLIEVLVSLVILSFGFSALYYWFMAYGTLSAKDRIRVEAQMILHAESERLKARPELAIDSSWYQSIGTDSFHITLDVTDRKDLEYLADSMGLSEARIPHFLNRPKEVNMTIIQSKNDKELYRIQYYLVTGGVQHVSP